MELTTGTFNIVTITSSGAIAYFIGRRRNRGLYSWSEHLGCINPRNIVVCALSRIPLNGNFRLVIL